LLCHFAPEKFRVLSCFQAKGDLFCQFISMIEANDASFNQFIGLSEVEGGLFDQSVC
jgi:hypothetical protein